MENYIKATSIGCNPVSLPTEVNRDRASKTAETVCQLPFNGFPVPCELAVCAIVSGVLNGGYKKILFDVSESEIAAPCWHSLEFPIIFQLCLINDCVAIGYFCRRNQ